MERYKNNPIVISGPSGAGKSELIDYIEKQYSDFIEAIGMTTRAKRQGEVGKMNFVSREEFTKLILTNGLIEYCTYNNNYYGVPKSEFEKLNDYHVMFNVGYSSAKEIKKLYEKTQMIYLLPPTERELLRRLGDREYERFLAGIKETTDNALKYDSLLISLTDDLQKTTDNFMEIVSEKNEAKQYKMVLSKNRDFVRNFYKRGD